MKQLELIEHETFNYLTAYSYGEHIVYVDDGIAGTYNVFVDDQRVGSIDIENFISVENIPCECYEEYVRDNPEDEDIVCANLLWCQDYLPDGIVDNIQEEFYNEVKFLVENWLGENE